MMAEIEAGHIGVVIVKDMSRFGRDYLQVGYYTEMFFPERGIRFIAVVNDVDSKKPSSSNDFLPFLNVMNEWYAKDTSRKIKAIFHSRMEKGERCTGSAPYGFMAAKVNGVYQLVIDEEAAKVIRRIFSMAAEGKSTREIADALTADKVLVPSAYDQQTEGRPNYRGAVKEPFHWKISNVLTILNRPEYMGTLVLGKSVRPSFRSKKRVATDKSQWMVFPEAHEAIVSPELWEKANRVRRHYVNYTPAGTYANRLSGLIYCADCGNPARQGSVLLAVWPASAGKQRVLLTLYSDRSARGDHQSRPQVSCRERVGGQRRVLPGAAGAAGRAADPDQRRRAGRDPEAGCEDRGD